MIWTSALLCRRPRLYTKLYARAQLIAGPIRPVQTIASCRPDSRLIGPDPRDGHTLFPNFNDVPRRYDIYCRIAFNQEQISPAARFNDPSIIKMEGLRRGRCRGYQSLQGGETCAHKKAQFLVQGCSIGDALNWRIGPSQNWNVSSDKLFHPARVESQMLLSFGFCGTLSAAIHLWRMYGERCGSCAVAIPRDTPQSR